MVFEALEEAQGEASQVRGGMYWHAGPASSPQNQYLVRTTPAGVETSLGPRAPETEAIYERFTQRKRESTERVAGLKAALEQNQRMNRALRVGRVDPLVVALLGRLASTHLSPHFRVIGTHALYAYETAAGVRLDPDTLATRDIDLLWDTRKRILFSTPLARVDSSMLGVLKKVDSSFRIRKSQKYTAVNKDGFEVGIIRRERTDDDPHPIKLSDDDEDFWVVQARRANLLLDSPGFSAVIVASNGTMARMNTVHPADLCHLQTLAGQPDRTRSPQAAAGCAAGGCGAGAVGGVFAAGLMPNWLVALFGIARAAMKNIVNDDCSGFRSVHHLANETHGVCFNLKRYPACIASKIPRWGELA